MHQVGPISGKHHYHQTNNRNGELLCELQHSTNLINLCTKAQYQWRQSTTRSHINQQEMEK